MDTKVKITVVQAGEHRATFHPATNRFECEVLPSEGTLKFGKDYPFEYRSKLVGTVDGFVQVIEATTYFADSQGLLDNLRLCGYSITKED